MEISRQQQSEDQPSGMDSLHRKEGGPKQAPPLTPRGSVPYLTRPAVLGGLPQTPRSRLCRIEPYIPLRLCKDMYFRFGAPFF